MFIIRFSDGVSLTFQKTAAKVHVNIEPQVDYVFTSAQYAWLKGQACAKVISRVSRVEPRLKNFTYKADPGTLLFFAGAGGYGDQLMAAPVAKALAEKYQVTVITDPGNQPCWWNYPFVKAILTFPLPLATFMMFDHHAMMEYVTNVDEHPDQRHPVDAMLHRLGLPDIPAEQKALAPALTVDEVETAARFLAGKKIALYQLGGSGENRRLTSAASRELLFQLAETYREFNWLAIGDRHLPPAYMEAFPNDAPRNASLAELQSLRQVFSLARHAVVGVGPDSLLMHTMGSMHKPFVGLWGPLHPELRTRYYRNHVPVWQQAACAVSPCLRYVASLEKCPPQASARGACLCLQDIRIEQVTSAVQKVLYTVP